MMVSEFWRTNLLSLLDLPHYSLHSPTPLLYMLCASIKKPVITTLFSYSLHNTSFGYLQSPRYTSEHYRVEVEGGSTRHRDMEIKI